MRGLSAATGGLVGERDPAQPLLTHLDGPARVELSGATTANWVAKNANLLVDGYGGPQQVGVLLPLHWQAVCVLLAGVATGAAVTVAADADDLAGCELALTSADRAGAVLAAGVDDVLVVSLHPLGLATGPVPPGAGDHAAEVPGHGDHWGGPAPRSVQVRAAGRAVVPATGLGLGSGDRVLAALDLAVPGELAVLLGVLAAGSALVLVPDPAGVDLDRAVGVEQVSATAGVDVAGVRRLPVSP